MSVLDSKGSNVIKSIPQTDTSGWGEGGDGGDNPGGGDRSFLLLLLMCSFVVSLVYFLLHKKVFFCGMPPKEHTNHIQIIYTMPTIEEFQLTTAEREKERRKVKRDQVRRMLFER